MNTVLYQNNLMLGESHIHFLFHYQKRTFLEGSYKNISPQGPILSLHYLLLFLFGHGRPCKWEIKGMDRKRRADKCGLGEIGDE